MPKMNRMRITGLKYDGMKKQYNDVTLNFHNQKEASNVLISLMNGGGKGVLLQTMFQIIKPGTSWGKKDNRLYQQFFFNEKEKFVPYTFHLTVEWELDGAEKRYVITGGSFSAERFVPSSEEIHDYVIKPSFSFFTKEHTGEEDALANIPLFVDGISQSFDSLKTYFKNEQYDTYKGLPKHYKLLESYGIDRKDWDIIKDINKDEGGVGKFFEGTEEDYSLFQKKIIPVVSQVLNKNENGENDLVEIFKSQASIAKDLPVLLKREHAHREFLQDILPFEQTLLHGQEHQENIKDSTQKGQRFVSALSYIITTETDALKKLMHEVAKLEGIFNRKQFEKDNLEYATLHQNLVSLSKLLTQKQQEFETIQSTIETKEEQVQNLSLDIVYKEWDTIVKNIHTIQEQMDTIEKNASLQEINERLDSIRTEATSSWDTIYQLLQQELQAYENYLCYMEENERTFHMNKEKAIQSIAKYNNELMHLQKEIQTYESKRESFVSSYGEKVMYQIDAVLSEHNEEKGRLLNKKDRANKEEQTLQEKRQDIAVQIGSAKQQMQSIEKEIKKANARIQKQEEKEKELSHKLSIATEEEITTLHTLDLQRYAETLQNVMQSTMQNIESHKRSLWNSQLNESLNTETYWIANHDLKQAKETLSKHMEVVYGTEFLSFYTEEERNEQMKKFPLLPFGLIVYQNEWEKEKTKAYMNQVLQSPIPIFIREKMNETETYSFSLLQGKQSEFASNLSSFETWKTSISEEMKETQDIIRELEKKVRFIQTIQQDLHALSQQDLCEILQEGLYELETERNHASESLRLLETEEAHTKEKQRTLHESIRTLEKQIEAIKENIASLKTFKEDSEAHEEHVFSQKKKQEQLEQEQVKKEEIEQQLSSLVANKKEWEKTFLRWEEMYKQNIQSISELVEEASFPVLSQVEKSETVPALSNEITKDLLLLVTEYHQLQQSKEAQSQDLIRLRVEIDHEKKNKTKKEKTLRSLNENWENQTLATEPIEVLVANKKEIEVSLQEMKKKERVVENELTKIATKIDVQTENKEKVQQKIETTHTDTVETWEDFDLKEKEIEIKETLSLAKQELQAAKTLQKDVTSSIQKYEVNKEKLLLLLESEDNFPHEPSDLEIVKQEADSAIHVWSKENKALKDEADKLHRRIEQSLQKLRSVIEQKDWELKFKNDLLASFGRLQLQKYEHALSIILGMKQFSQKGIEQLDKDKERAERAQEFWASRAAMKVMSISEAVRTMISKMRFKNDLGNFPLVDLKEDILPRKPEEIEPLLKNHFVTSIEKITKEFETIEEGNELLNKAIKALVGDEQIFFVALRHRYPTLLVYNMQTNNAFMYGRPKKEYYSTWKTINTGSETKSDGSGGQKLSARMIVMMMLLSSKQNSDSVWTTLVCDNPFGQAASEHVLDPMFVVAEKLKFQLIIVTPPELVKTDISQRFPVYYKLDFKQEKGKEVINDNVQFSYRIYN